jgi:hypothetical protein
VIPLPTVDQTQMLGYDAIRYVPGYPESYVKSYAEAYAATREAAAVAVERERCAKVCETFQAEAESNAGKLWTRACADAIRAGSAGGES